MQLDLWAGFVRRKIKYILFVSFDWKYIAKIVEQVVP